MQRYIPDFLLQIGRHLYPDGSLRNIVTLSSGSVIGQAILAATSPIISRLYTPDEFGLFSIFFSTFGIISIISTLQYPNAIPLPPKDTDGARLLAASLGVLVVFTLLLWALIGGKGEAVLGLAGLDEHYPLFWLLPVAILVANANLCLQFWFLRKKEFTNLAVVKGVQSIGMAAGQIAMGFWHLGAVGLIIGHILGQAAGIVQMTTGLFRRYSGVLRDTTLTKLHADLWEKRSFVTTYTPSALLGAGTIYLPAILLGVLYGPAVAGVFAFALQLSKAGIQIIVQSIGRVYLVDSIDDFNRGDNERIKKRALRFALSQFLIGAPFFLALVLFGETIFDFIFGENWALGGLYVALLTPHLLTLFMFDHLVTLFVVTGKHQSKLLWDGMKFIVLVSTFAAAKILDLSPETAIFILSCGWGILYVLLVPITFRSLGDQTRREESLAG